MTLAKRKISTKKFLPSLTEIPEEIQNSEEVSEKWSTISRNRREKPDTVVCENITNLEYQNDDKDKRQIIQKWLQSIPTNDPCQKGCVENVESVVKEFLDDEILSDQLEMRDFETSRNKPIETQVSQKQWKQNKRSSERKQKLVPASSEAVYVNKQNLERKQKLVSTSLDDAYVSKQSLERRQKPVSASSDIAYVNKQSLERRQKPVSTNLDDTYERKQSLERRQKPVSAGSDITYVNKRSLDRRQKPVSVNTEAVYVNKLSLERRQKPVLANSEVTYISNGGTNSTFNSNLPLDEELTMQNTIYNVATGNTTLSKLRMYEANNRQGHLEGAEGRYSLVSEVYVNDGFSSSGSSLSSSTKSLTTPVGANKNEQNEESSRLMIELNDCPFFYSIENMDDFEPDTLDRKPSKDEERLYSGSKFIDSLERPAICLRTRGSFRNESTFICRGNNLKRSFGSLQEIYQQRRSVDWNQQIPADSNAPLSLTPQVESFLWRKDKPQQPRHYYRQRKLSPPPPLPCDTSSFKRNKPPLPPRSREGPPNPSLLKEHNCRTSVAMKEQKVCFKNNVWSYRPDDSGYLSSSDSDRSQHFATSCDTINDSIRVVEATINLRSSEVEDDDDESVSSYNDGNSESGAESTATNFKFYKNRGRVMAEA